MNASRSRIGSASEAATAEMDNVGAETGAVGVEESPREVRPARAGMVSIGVIPRDDLAICWLTFWLTPASLARVGAGSAGLATGLGTGLDRGVRLGAEAMAIGRG